MSMKTNIMIAYALMTLVFGVVGYMIGRKSHKGYAYTMAGIILGVIATVVLWTTIGEKMVRDDKAKNEAYMY